MAAVLGGACSAQTSGGSSTSTPADQGSATSSPVTITGPFLVDLTTEDEVPLADTFTGGYSFAASPDGTQVAFGTGDTGGCSQGEEASLAELDGSYARDLTSPDGGNICGVRWSPDGTRIVYQERNGAAPASVGNLFVRNVSSGTITQITHLELSKAWWWFLAPTFTPDGQHVIFHLPRSSTKATGWDVWSVPAMGGRPSLVLQDAASPMYLEDDEIAFVSPARNIFAGDRLLIRAADGSIRTLMDANQGIWWPSLSPDGRQIAYQDGGEIYVIDVGTGEPSLVTYGNTAGWLDDDTLMISPG